MSLEINPSDFIIYNVSPALADDNVEAAVLNGQKIGFEGRPQHPMADLEDPNAYFMPGTQFWPGVMESADRTVELLGSAKPAFGAAMATPSPPTGPSRTARRRTGCASCTSGRGPPG